VIGESVRWRSRIFRAATTAAFNIVLWVVIPYFVYGGLTRLEPTAASATSSGIFSLDFIYTFGAIITGLEVMGALTDGMAISVPLVSGGYIASAYFIYAAVSGGTFALETAGLKIVLSFQLLLFLLMLPSLFGAVKGPITFLLERTEAGRGASDLV
jgi:hypothetical protein